MRSRAASLDLVARNLLAWGISACAFRLPDRSAAETDVEMLISQKDGRMSRILSIGDVRVGMIQGGGGGGGRARVVQPMPDLMRDARRRVVLRN